MSKVEVLYVSTDLINNRCRVGLRLSGNRRVEISQLLCNPPGEQTESELKDLAIEAAIGTLQEVVDGSLSEAA